MPQKISYINARLMQRSPAIIVGIGVQVASQGMGCPNNSACQSVPNITHICLRAGEIFLPRCGVGHGNTRQVICIGNAASVVASHCFGDIAAFLRNPVTQAWVHRTRNYVGVSKDAILGHRKYLALRASIDRGAIAGGGWPVACCQLILEDSIGFAIVANDWSDEANAFLHYYCQRYAYEFSQQSTLQDLYEVYHLETYGGQCLLL